MTLHVVYRSCGGENRKNRPVFYSKALALASFVRASAATGVPTGPQTWLGRARGIRPGGRPAARWVRP